MDILVKSIVCLWALGHTYVSTIMPDLLSDMAIKSSSRLFGSWAIFVHSRFIFEIVISVALELITP